MKRLALRIAPLAVGLALLAPSAALAHGHRSHAPVRGSHINASLLCREAKAGHLPASLSPQASRITTDCSTLQTALSSARTTLKSELAPLTTKKQSAWSTYRAAVKSARATRHSALAAAGTNVAAREAAKSAYRAAVKQAAQNLSAALKPLRTAAAADYKQYRQAVATAEKAFLTDVDAALGITPASRS